MSNIRRQSIISSFVIYIGFLVGLLNTYFFTRQGLFTSANYGLTSIFVNIATMMSAFATMAMPFYIHKFFPYYKDNVPERKNDMLTWALLISTIGFGLVMVAGWVFKHQVIRKFGAHSPELLTYYYWIFPMGFGLTVYTVLEAYTWNLGKPILTTFLKEVFWRLVTTVLVVLFTLKIIGDFDLFIKLYSLGFPIIAVILFTYLVVTKRIHFVFEVSRASRRFFKKILVFCLFVYGSMIITTLSQVFDSIVIASILEDGMAKAGIFGLAQIMAMVIQVPQRGIVAASTPHLSRAWKEKNMELLQKIYQRSSLNQLIFAIGLFVLIALNYQEAILTFNLKNDFLLGFNAFLFLGLTKIIDMGTGLNAQIISNSNYWRFEFYNGVVLLILMLPLTIFLTRHYGLVGPAIASFISISLFNLVRIIFLWYKFRLFPFTIQTLYVVLLGVAGLVACHYAFINVHGLLGIAIRVLSFGLIYGGTTFYFKLSPDIIPVIHTMAKRMGLKKK